MIYVQQLKYRKCGRYPPNQGTISREHGYLRDVIGEWGWLPPTQCQSPRSMIPYPALNLLSAKLPKMNAMVDIHAKY